MPNPPPRPPGSLRPRELGAAMAALATAAVVHAQPRVIYADASNTAGAHTGASWQTAYRDLQDALLAARIDPNRATRGVEVRIAQGIYTPDRASGDRYASFVLNSAVTLMGGFAGLKGSNPDERDPRQFVSVLSGDLSRNDGPAFTNYADNSRTIVSADTADGSAALDGLEISGGSAVTPVISKASSLPSAGLTLRGCTITRNLGGSGRVLHLRNSTLISCRIVDNRADNSAILFGSGNTLDACEIRGNRTTGQPIVSIVKFFSLGATDRFRRCLIADNISGAGGTLGAFESAMTIELSGCTLAGNAGLLPAVYSQLGLVRLRNCIIARNTTFSQPMNATQVAVQNASLLDMSGPTLVDNGAAGFAFLTGGTPAVSVLSGDPMFVSPNGPDQDPLLWEDNNFHLRPGSPAIDAADSSAPGFLPTDFEGRPLYDDPAAANAGFGPFAYADIGASEFNGQLCPLDFDRSGTVSVADIFAFLNAWLASDPEADFNGGGLAVQDIFDFVNAWLRGC
ncbi:MAG TPA: right-handed parallel beta-helix repeat-containing protein [Phycisphaerales bacterium]|nr:right-handed parallel beta-helix repeat-containing protein [Phycisphaerales bacterium]